MCILNTIIYIPALIIWCDLYVCVYVCLCRSSESVFILFVYLILAFICLFLGFVFHSTAAAKNTENRVDSNGIQHELLKQSVERKTTATIEKKWFTHP